jgi:hypothetical protein
MNEFVYKLGESKAEKLRYEFTQVHNEDAYRIIREVGPEGFALYFVLSSIAMGKDTVMLTLNLAEITGTLGISERTLQRWKRRLEDANIIRTVPCYLPTSGEDKTKKGAQVESVILLNASYPDIPEGWQEFAPNGFVLVDGKPILWEEYQKLFVISEVGARKFKRSRGVKNGTPGVTKMTPHRGDKNDTPGVTEMTPQGVTKMTPPKSPRNRANTEVFAPADEPKKYKEDHKKNDVRKNTGTTDDRYSTFYELFPELRGHTGALK